MTNLYFVLGDTSFTKTEQKILNYIMENPDSFLHMSIVELARCTASSEPTISRFARHCGYADFKELKQAVYAHMTEENSPSAKLSSTLNKNAESTLENFLRQQQHCIEKTLSFLDTQHIEQAVSAIQHASTVYLYGKGASLSMAQLLHFRLQRFGIRVILLPSGSSELFEYMNLLTPKDLVILFGFQKTPREASVLLDYQKKMHYKCIFFTSRLYQDTDNPDLIPIYVYRGDPTEFHSMAAPAAVLDAISVILGAKLGQKSKHYLDRLYQMKEHYKTDIPR